GWRQLKLAEVIDCPLKADYVLLNGTLHYERDIEDYLSKVRAMMSDDSRLIVTYYSALWRPLLSLATFFGLRSKTPELNWLAHSDLRNFMRLADFDVVRVEPRVLIPIYIPLLSAFVNRFLAP